MNPKRKVKCSNKKATFSDKNSKFRSHLHYQSKRQCREQAQKSSTEERSSRLLLFHSQVGLTAAHPQCYLPLQKSYKSNCIKSAEIDAHQVLKLGIWWREWLTSNKLWKLPPDHDNKRMQKHVPNKCVYITKKFFSECICLQHKVGNVNRVAVSNRIGANKGMSWTALGSIMCHQIALLAIMQRLYFQGNTPKVDQPTCCQALSQQANLLHKRTTHSST